MLVYYLFFFFLYLFFFFLFLFFCFVIALVASQPSTHNYGGPHATSKYTIDLQLGLSGLMPLESRHSPCNWFICFFMPLASGHSTCNWVFYFDAHLHVDIRLATFFCWFQFKSTVNFATGFSCFMPLAGRGSIRNCGIIFCLFVATCK